MLMRFTFCLLSVLAVVLSLEQNQPTTSNTVNKNVNPAIVPYPILMQSNQGSSLPPYVSGLPQPYPMASPMTMGHMYGGFGVPVHPYYRSLHAMIGAPPPPLIPYGAPYYPPYQ
eukprot:c9383_g1_i1.p1 GENE.c9383_g1_i1~~c9383_g1_i1.p1  ORF type:complete len:123 (+),score=41.83 c9383_g1_i1:30-371(+)